MYFFYFISKLENVIFWSFWCTMRCLIHYVSAFGKGNGSFQIHNLSIRMGSSMLWIISLILKTVFNDHQVLFWCVMLMLAQISIHGLVLEWEIIVYLWIYFQDPSLVLVLQLAFQTIGVVYSGLGTSPLYVYGNAFNDVEIGSTSDILGALSIVIYTLTLIPLIKYDFVVLRANGTGESDFKGHWLLVLFVFGS
mgnify:CR=1 FL=1